MMLVVVVLALGIGRGLGLRWDPFDLAGRRLEAAETRADTLDRNLSARRLEVEGAQAQARRTTRHHQTLNAVAATTARTLERTEQADDAEILLEADRADRLRDHDRELCHLSPAVCGPAATDPAG
jgi:protein subunit release factor A